MSYTVIEKSISCASASDHLSEKIVKQSFSKLDWPTLNAHLEDICITAPMFETFTGHLRRASGLIMERPDDKRELARTAYFDSLSSYIKSKLGDQVKDSLSAEIDLLLKIESGYRSILTCLAATDIAKKPADLRISACIHRAAQQHSHVTNEVRRELENRASSGRAINASILLTEGEYQISPDGVIENIVDLLTSTVLLEAYNNSWFDTDQFVVLPIVRPVSEQDIYQAGSVELLAQGWKQWRLIEEKMRYWGGKLEYFDADDLPSQIKGRDIKLTTYSPPDDVFFDYAANARLKDFFEQTFSQLFFETIVTTKCSGIQNKVALLPQSFVTISEAHAATSLSNILGYNITTDNDTPGGLRLVEWLRCYTVLEQFANNQPKDAVNNTHLIINLKNDELFSIFERCGVSREKASVFVKNASLCSKSRDMYDCPLIKLEDKSFLIYAPSVTATNWAMTVLSNISRLGVPLTKKGEEFEKHILELLKSNGLQANPLKFTRDNQEYQYDALLDWDDYLFIFECKNYSLSNNDPISAYYFDREIQSHCKQVKRQYDALFRYPDVIRDQLGIDIAKKKVIPCVLNSLPYSLPGPIDGIYITDASALTKFFSERYLHIKEPIKIDSNTTVIHRDAVYSLWSSDKPSPQDLIRQMNAPIQLKIIRDHTEIFQIPFRLGEKWGAFSSAFFQIEKTVDSMSKCFGVSGSKVKKTLDDVRKKLRKIMSKNDRRSKHGHK